MRGVLLALCAAGAACGGGAGGAGSPPQPELVRLDELEHRVRPTGDEEVVLLNFWATWCGPCVAEMPELVELHEEWDGRGVRVQTVALDLAAPAGDIDTLDEIAAFAAGRSFDLPILVYDGDLHELQQRFELPAGIPYTVAIAEDGRVAARQEGAAGRERFTQMIVAARGR